ncbi:hypothetical protein HK405_011008 [Cladochytrium tenue]|nr:hypothetical protein HK405_011008 [Cladochytrium tenue]
MIPGVAIGGATEVDPAAFPLSFDQPSMAAMYALHGVALACNAASIAGSVFIQIDSFKNSRYQTIGERYLLIYLKMAKSAASINGNSARNGASASSESASNASQSKPGAPKPVINRRATMRLVQHVAADIICYCPLLFYGLSISAFKTEPYGLALVVVATLNSAGLMNALVVIITGSGNSLCPLQYPTIQWLSQG